MPRGAWQATVRGVAQSWTWRRDFYTFYPKFRYLSIVWNLGSYPRISLQNDSGTRWRRSGWIWSTSLSLDASGIHLQVQISQNRSWKQAGVPDYQKGIYRYIQNSVGWRDRGKKRRRVVRTRSAPMVGGGTEAEVRYPHESNCLGQRRGIWGCWRVKQLICDSLNGVRTTQTICAAALHAPDRDIP